MARPTDEAKRYFDFANMWMNQIVQQAALGPTDHNVFTMAMGVTNLAYGLSNLAVGLRATYIKLEEVERLLKQVKR